MERYKLISKLGSGGFGSVYKAIDRSTGEFVAIKKLRQRFKTKEGSLDLREIQALKDLNHPHIVKLIAAFRENERVFLVFEFMGPSLYQAFTSSAAHFLSEEKIRWFFYQALLGVAYLHSQGYVHRDIKPENMLLSGGSMKIIDFGLARKIRHPNSDDDEGRPWTEYVSTRWYRAPEIVLRSPTYGPPADIFALGAVFAEVFSGRPLFPGTSEPDQIACMAAVMGPPTRQNWPHGAELLENLGVVVQDVGDEDASKCLFLHHLVVNTKIPNNSGRAMSQDAADLIVSMCAWNPSRRITAQQALRHPYFSTLRETFEATGSRQQQPLPPPLSSLAAASLAENLSKASQKLLNASSLSQPALKKLAVRASNRQKSKINNNTAHSSPYFLHF